MATRSFIAKYNHDKHEYTAIYCHWDGYPTGVGLTLREYYDYPQSVDTLLTFGDISSLRDTLAETMGEAYRVRGDKNTDAVTFKTFTQMVEHYRGMWCEYGYVYCADVKWECYKLDPQEIDLYTLTKEIANV
jgi:hypothetical protein